MTLDPASLQILISRLTGVAEEMGAVLRRAASSPNIKERADCSAALFTADGELLVQAEHIPVHLGSMPASVRAAIDVVGIEGLRPGDHVILNDPFAGGTHLNDITLVTPCFVGGQLVGWAANRAHHADVGGMTPGSIPPDATEIAQEGFRIPPVVLSPAVVALLLANSRTPEERRGDLDAQVGANEVGVQRLAGFAGEPLDEVLDYGERRMRAAISQLDDGVYVFEDVLDSTGPNEDQRHPARVKVMVTVDEDRATFDFTGTDQQRAGNVNAVEAVTISAVAFAVRAATDPTIPANGGAMRPVTVIAPRGTIVAAVAPAAVGAGNVEVSQRVADVCLGALAQAAPARVGAAGQGTMNNLMIGGEGWVYYETIAGGQGGRPNKRAGMSGVHTAMTNTLNTPVEALERAYPMRVLRYRLRRGSGGAGVAAGGDGIERDLQVLEECTVSLITERRHSQPWGVAGGGPGAVGENWLLPGGEEARAERLLDKCTVRLRAGDVLRMSTPGGGGWGAPAGVAIRPMAPADVERVQAIEIAAGQLFRSFPEPRIAACADHAPMPSGALGDFIDAGAAWVATVDGEPVGFVVVEVFDGAAHVEEIAVDPAHGRRGVGTRLLDTVAEWAAGQRLAALTLTTFYDVPWNRPFYEFRGFLVVDHAGQSKAMRAKVAHEEAAYGLPRELRVVMRRDLPSPLSQW
ncbi:MAG TPA: GNAT family N-acetyltransferase [Acidimicrobiales bacterium]|nr:GNAT family N-acetyltransferase [Acidimicrobiales bacterium]